MRGIQQQYSWCLPACQARCSPLRRPPCQDPADRSGQSIPDQPQRSSQSLLEFWKSNERQTPSFEYDYPPANPHTLTGNVKIFRKTLIKRQKPKCKCPNRYGVYLGKAPVAITTSCKQQHNPFNQNMELKGAQLLWGPAGTGGLYSVFINVSCTKHLYSDL